MTHHLTHDGLRAVAHEYILPGKVAQLERERDAYQQAADKLAMQCKTMRDALDSISDCCDEDHAARDYCSRQTEIRGIARAALKGEVK